MHKLLRGYRKCTYVPGMSCSYWYIYWCVLFDCIWANKMMMMMMEGSFVLLPTVTWQRLLTFAVTWSSNRCLRRGWWLFVVVKCWLVVQQGCKCVILAPLHKWKHILLVGGKYNPHDFSRLCCTIYCREQVCYWQCCRQSSFNQRLAQVWTLCSIHKAASIYSINIELDQH